MGKAVDKTILGVGVLLAVLATGWAGVPEVSAQDPAREVTFQASDGVRVWADLVRAGGTRPLVLLFHQGGGDARGEYAFLIPALVERGYDVMATDLRRGGDLFGSVNRTARGVGDAAYSYCSAAADVEAALAYALELPDVRGAPILWGSSYSAALVIRLAAERGDEVAGVLAFSPATGDPMAGCMPEAAARALTVPALALRPEGEAALPAVAEQLRVLAAAGVETFVSSPGVHGSSMLDPDRAGDVGPTWAVVDAFLTRLRSAGRALR